MNSVVLIDNSRQNPEEFLRTLHGALPDVRFRSLPYPLPEDDWPSIRKADLILLRLAGTSAGLPSVFRDIRRHTGCPAVLLSQSRFRDNTRQKLLEAGCDLILPAGSAPGFLAAQIRSLLRLAGRIPPDVNRPGHGNEIGFQEMLHRLIEHMPDYALVIDPSAPEGPQIIDANQAAHRFHGYRPPELIGLPIATLDSLPEKKKISERATQILENGYLRFRTTHRRKDGSTFPVDVSAHLIQFGGRMYIVSIERDLSHYQQTLDELAQREKNFEDLVENLQDGVIIADQNGKHIYVNRRAAEITGYSTDELLRLSLKEMTPAADLPRYQKMYRKRIKGMAVPNRYERNIVRRDGRIIPVELTATVTTWKGQPAGMATLHDISRQKKTEQALRESEEKYKRLIKYSPVGMLILKKGVVVFVNDAFLKTMAFSSESEIVGKSITRFIHSDYLELARRRLQKLANSPGTVVEPMEEKFIRANGQIIDVLVIGQSIEFEGEPAIQGYVYDVTETRRTHEALRESEERYRTIVENSHAGITLIDDRQRFLYVNPRFAEITGYPKEALIHRNFEDVLDEQSKRLVTERYKLRQQGKAVPAIYEFNIRRKDGELRRVEIRSAVFQLPDGSKQTVAQILDITRRKQLETDILFERDLLHALMDNIPDAVYFKDDQSRFLRINRAYAGYLGLSSPEMAIGKKESDILPRQTAEESRRDEQKIIKTGRPLINKIEKVTYPNGQEVWGSVTKVPIYDKDNRITGIAGITRDITDQMRLKMALEQSVQMYRNLINQSNDAIYLLYDQKFEMINPSFQKLFGYSQHEVKGANFSFMQLISPGSRPVIEDRIRRQQRGEPLEPIYEFTALSKDGREIECEVSVSYIQYKDGIATQGIIRDITERKKAEAQLARLATVIEQASESVVITDTAGNIEYVNPAFEQISGYSAREAVGENPRILKSGQQGTEFYRDLWDTITSGRVWRGTFVNRKKDGSIYHEEAVIFPIKDNHGQIINYAAVKHDVTSQRKLQDQFRQAQKMEAIGKLAGGVAHDFNNLLTVINGYCELLLQRIAPDQPYFKEISQIQKAGERAASLTSQLLAFSRKQVIQPRIINVNTIVRKAENLLRRLIGEDVELIMNLTPDPGNVKLDPGQLDQVIMNIAVNARDAMPNGGQLIIETSNVTLDDTYLQTHPMALPGPYVLLAITDTGIGMDQSTREHIFEPFFTTKGRGKGTGLGLSTVYGIIKQNNGFIWVYSEPGEGTTFKIYLPRVDDPENAIRDTGSAGEVLEGHESILLVEDEGSLRRLAYNVLTEHGYRVLPAQDGPEALQILAKHQEPVDLLLTDVIMPKMSGSELAAAILEQYPDTAVLYMSGYTDNAIVHHGVLDADTHFIQKPFGPATLLKKIRAILDNRTTG